MLIKIDRQTIVKNPNAGNSTYYQYLGETWYVDGEEYHGETDSKTLVSIVLSGKSLKRVANVQPIYSIARQPSYLFDYLDNLVQCENCLQEFPHKELVSDWCEDDLFSDTICPKCGAWDCCEIEYEKFTDDMINESIICK